VAVVYPVYAASLLPALDAATAGLIAPIPIGPASRIQPVAHGGRSRHHPTVRLIDAPDGPAAAAKAVALACSGEVAL
jgi:hypothetical protein